MPWCYYNTFHWQTFVLVNNASLSEASGFLITAVIAPQGNKMAGLKAKSNLKEMQVIPRGLQPQPQPGARAAWSSLLPQVRGERRPAADTLQEAGAEGSCFPEVVVMVPAGLAFPFSLYLHGPAIWNGTAVTTSASSLALPALRAQFSLPMSSLSGLVYLESHLPWLLLHRATFSELIHVSVTTQQHFN